MCYKIAYCSLSSEHNFSQKFWVFHVVHFEVKNCQTEFFKPTLNISNVHSIFSQNTWFIIAAFSALLPIVYKYKKVSFAKIMSICNGKDDYKPGYANKKSIMKTGRQAFTYAPYNLYFVILWHLTKKVTTYFVKCSTINLYQLPTLLY